MLPLIAAGMAAGMAAAGIGAAAKGLDSAGRKDTKAKNAIKANAVLYDEMGQPILQDVDYNKDSWMGGYTPEGVDPRTMDASVVDGTAYDGISGDPRLKEQQLAALAGLTDLANNGGMTAQDKANLARVQNETGQADRGRRDAIKRNMAQRGMGGSGMELLAQLQSSQAATDRSAQQGLDIAGMQQQRALDALQGSGTLAGNLRSQDFGEQSRVADARDAVNKFNANQRQSTNQFNTGALNSGQQFNAGSRNDAARFNSEGKQGVQTANTATANKQQYTNRVELPGQRWDAQYKQTAAKAGVNQDMAGINAKGADRDAQMWGGIANGMFTMGGAAAGKSDERAKKNIEDLSSKDIEEFLKALNPKNFKYKDTKDGAGDKIGFMMQDIEKTKAGKTISRTTDDGMKGYDQQGLQGITLAALKHLADKVNKGDK